MLSAGSTKPHSAQFKSVLTNLGLEYAYLNAKDFATFWDADAKRANEAVDKSAACGIKTRLQAP